MLYYDSESKKRVLSYSMCAFVLFCPKSKEMMCLRYLQYITCERRKEGRKENQPKQNIDFLDVVGNIGYIKSEDLQ